MSGARGPRRRLGSLAAALLAVLVATPVGAEERWYAVTVAESPVGWMVERTATEDGRRVEETRLELRFVRGDLEQRMAQESRFEETLDGEPLAARSVQELGATRLVEEWTFRERDLVVRSHAGGEESVRHLPRPAAGWPRPGDESERLLDALGSGAERFEVEVLDPMVGARRVRSVWELEARGEIVETSRGSDEASRWRQTWDFAPEVPTLVWVDVQGTVLRTRTALLGLEVDTVLATEATARRAEGAPPELLLRSFVEPDRRIERPRRLRRAVYELRVEGARLDNVPSFGLQTVEPAGKAVRVTVDLGRPPVPAGEVDRARYLVASPHLDHRDPATRELLAAAAPLPEDPAERARELRRLVGRHLETYDLRSLMATASEVARSRTGDCTEHSVLLAALLRASGIPSRVVFGLIYVEGFLGREEIFGYHMWTQALVDDRWLDLDALTPEDFDAAHLALAASGLEDPGSMVVEMARIAPLLGRLEIAVVELDWNDAAAGAAAAGPGR